MCTEWVRTGPPSLALQKEKDKGENKRRGKGRGEGRERGGRGEEEGKRIWLVNVCHASTKI